MACEAQAQADRILRNARLSAVSLILTAYGLVGLYVAHSLALSAGRATPATVLSFSLLPDASPDSGLPDSRMASTPTPTHTSTPMPMPMPTPMPVPVPPRESRSPGPTTSPRPTQRQIGSPRSSTADNAAAAVVPASIGSTSDVVVVSQLDYDGPPPRPVYPQHALRARQQGLVRIRVLIGKDGSVLRADVSQSSGFELLDAAAVDAALRTKFRPYSRNGIAISASADLPFNFVVKP